MQRLPFVPGFHARKTGTENFTCLQSRFKRDGSVAPYFNNIPLTNDIGATVIYS